MTNCNYSEHTKIQKKEIQKQIEELQAKLEELEQQKSPVEVAFKDNYGVYPDELKSNDDFSYWVSFKRGYIAAKKDKESEYQPSMVNCILKGTPPDGYVTWNEWYNELGSKGILHNLKISSKEVEVNEWKDVALKFGEKLPVILPDGYYELSPAAWFRWVVFTYEKYMEQLDKESEYTPKLQEEVNKLQEKEWTYKITDEKGETNRYKQYLNSKKPASLYNCIADWWDDVFTAHSDLNMEASIESLVKRIIEFLPDVINEPSACDVAWNSGYNSGYNTYRHMLLMKINGK